MRPHYCYRTSVVCVYKNNVEGLNFVRQFKSRTTAKDHYYFDNKKTSILTLIIQQLLHFLPVKDFFFINAESVLIQTAAHLEGFL